MLDRLRLVCLASSLTKSFWFRIGCYVLPARVGCSVPPGAHTSDRDLPPFWPPVALMPRHSASTDSFIPVAVATRPSTPNRSQCTAYHHARSASTVARSCGPRRQQPRESSASQTAMFCGGSRPTTCAASTARSSCQQCQTLPSRCTASSTGTTPAGGISSASCGRTTAHSLLLPSAMTPAAVSRIPVVCCLLTPARAT